MFRRLLYAALSLFFFLILVTSQTHAVGVRPLVIDLNLSPGDTESFELVLRSGPTQETIDLNLYQPVQLITGGLAYQEGDADLYPPIDWVRLESERVIVPPDEEARVRGEARVPFNAGGSYTVVVMVEPAVDEEATGVTFRVRYAVRININVDRPGLRPRVELEDFGLTPDEDNLPLLTTLLRNPSPLHYPASGEVTIRDENRRLIERVSLRTQSAWQSGRIETRIYPGAEVLLQGEVTEYLYPGEYDLRLFLRYADGRQVIKRERIAVEEGEFEQRIAHLQINPERIEANIRPGATASQAVQVQNRTADPLLVKMGAREIEPDYPHSVFEHLDVQLRGEGEFSLNPHRHERGVFIFRSARDLEPGGYYGYLDVYAFSKDEEFLDSYQVPISLVVGEGWENEAEVLGVEYDYSDEEYLFSVDVRNLSKAHIVPTGTLYLKDEAGVIQRTLRLNLQEGVESILPQKAEHTVTSVRDRIEAGEYTADIRIIYQEEEIGVRELPLLIQP